MQGLCWDPAFYILKCRTFEGAKKTSILKYILLVALGAISYGILSSLVKIAHGHGYHSPDLSFAQAIIGTGILWIGAFFEQKKKDTRLLHWNWKLLLAGTTMGLTSYFFYLSLQYLPVSLAIVLLMQVAWISSLAEWLLYGKKTSWKEVMAMVLVLFGTVLAGNLASSYTWRFSLEGIALGFVAAIAYTAFTLSTSKLNNDLPPFEKSAWMTTGSALLLTAIHFFTAQLQFQIDVGLCQYGLLLAMFGAVIPPICFNIGMPKIGPGLSAILLTLELPAVVFGAYCLLGEKVTTWQVAGIGLMVIAITYLQWQKSPNEPLRKAS